MSPETFTTNLQVQAERLDLTASDLSIWFERPRATLRTWLENERTPKEGRVLDECARRLTLLRSSRDLPVPFHISARERPAYIKLAYDRADHAGVPARRSARAG